MMSQIRILHPILFALAMLLAGCAAVPRPNSTELSAAAFAITAPDARTIAVAGSFNRWDPSRHPLSGPDRSGRWTATLSLPPGRYEYLFVINGDLATPAMVMDDHPRDGDHLILMSVITGG